jgi:thiol:disulfide interchange protein DsbD
MNAKDWVLGMAWGARAARSIAVVRILANLKAWVAAFLLLGAFPASTLAADTAATKRVEIRLISEAMALPADGGVVTFAIHKKIIAGWHTYWRNAGDSGEPTSVSWTLPPGFQAGAIQWPYPKRIPIGHLANYGYEDEVWLLTDIAVPPGLQPGSQATVQAEVGWLVCKETCIPENASLSIDLEVASGAPQKSTLWIDGFENARERLPETPPLPAVFAADDKDLRLAISLPPQLRGADVHFFPETPGLIRNASPQTRWQTGDALVMSIPGGSKLRNQSQREALAIIEGVLVFADVGGKERAIAIKAAPGAVPTGGEVLSVEGQDAPLTLLGALGFALLGGLILNLMPCVFPVLSMKALALVRHGHVSRAKAAIDGLAYLGGVLIAFCALAAAVIVLRNAGEAVGWGFQLQSPFVVALLAFVLFAVGLNLSGVFSVGGGLMGLSGKVDSSGNTVASAFLTGILAVVVAAPCTVPFMGAAMGFALTQSTAITFLVLIALGVGLASPWLILSLVPGMLSLLPKPGVWMLRLKEILAFPMYASAAWLIWVASQQTDSSGLFRILLGLVAIAFAAWAFARRQDAKGSGVASSIAAILGLGAALALIATPPLPPPATLGARTGQDVSGPVWEAYSAQRLGQLRSEGKPVFINLTAAWCITCLFNEQIALGTQATAILFRDTGTVYLKGDWTNRDPEITELLRANGRDGVPLYLYYAPQAERATLLPQILTQSLIAETLTGSH